MLRRAFAALAVVADLAGAPASVPALGQTNTPVLTAEQQTIYGLALAAADQQRWDEVRRAIDVGGHPVGSKILRWVLLSSRSGAQFEEIAAFLRDNPDWPNPETLQRRAEEAMADNGNDGAVRALFARRTPLTPEGMARLASAMQRSGEGAQATALARTFWRNANLNETQERAFLARFATALGRPDHIARLDRLIWDGRTDDARRLLTLVDGETRRLAEARIAFATRARTAERSYEQVPAVRRDDLALQFERARFLRRRGDMSEALAIFTAIRMPPERARQWKSERDQYVRRLAETGDVANAYALARDHGLPVGSSEYAEAEFLAGWVALRFANNAGVAEPHFARLSEGSTSPITRARGAYWMGRAREAAGDRSGATEWYRRAAAFPMTFYGQVALGRVGGAAAWPSAPQASPAERAAFAQSELVQAAQLLRQLGGDAWLRAFLLRLSLIADTPPRYALVADLALALGRPDLAVSAAKRATSTTGATLIEQGWPVIPLPETAGLDPALVLSIIRQESAFEVRAQSRAGARGLMQLMPATGALVARRLGIQQQHNPARLLDDPAYNIRLGTAYLARGIDSFGGSYVLAIAAYNAGPGRSTQWVARNGDPRLDGTDVIDWIERIPFDETRNYVQRVMENLMVYRWRLQPTAQAASIEADLRRRRAVLPPLPTSDEAPPAPEAPADQ
jgi:soluble lytic murein transglycosylase